VFMYLSVRQHVTKYERDSEKTNKLLFENLE